MEDDGGEEARRGGQRSVDEEVREGLGERFGVASIPSCQETPDE